MNTVRNITLANSIFVRNDAKGNKINLDVTKLPDSIIGAIFEGGVKIVLTNVYNNGGKDKPVTEREASLLKKIDAWYRGEYVSIERGESQYTAMREQYYDERKEAAGQTRSEVDKAIKATVQDVFGKDEAATFAKFLLAVATQKLAAMGKDAPEGATAISIAEEIEAALAKRTAEAAAKRAEVAAKLQTKGIDLGL